MLGFGSLGQFSLGEFDAVPFGQADTTRMFTLRYQLTPPQPFNPNLYRNPVPFNQIDWAKPFRVPLALPQPQTGININLFTNPVPFNQTDWAKPFRVPHITPDSSVSLNPNLFRNPVPNNQTDWSLSRRVASFLPDASRGLNPNLVTVAALPFNQTDWSQSRRVSAETQVPDGLNPNLFTNPVPFNQSDWSKPVRVPLALASPPQPLNINLFTNPVPFKGALGSASPLDLRGSPDVSQPYNAALYTTTTAALPFNQTDWSASRRVIAEAQVPDGLNPNLFTNPLPFNQTDWAKPTRVPHITPDASLSLNPNLTNPVPFAAELLRSTPLRGTPDVSQPYNAALYAVTVVAVPFNQTDWATSRRIVGEAQVPDGLNINLFTNPVPFNQVYWPASFFPRALAQPPVGFNPNLDPKPFINLSTVTVALRGLSDVSQPYNPNLYSTTVVAVPFNQSDFARPFFPRALVPSADSLNINLFTNAMPFNQFDWSKPQQIRITQPQPQSGLNINLFTNPVPVANLALAAPFAVRALPTPSQAYNPNLYGVVAVSVPLNQFDVAKPFFPRALALPTDPLNINLFTNAVPFNQTDWTASRRLVGETQVPDGLNLNLFTNPVPFGAADTGSRRLAALTPPDQPYNVALYTVTVVAAQPFKQGDVPLVRRPLAAVVLSDPLNPNLFRNDVPIGNVDTSVPMRLRAALDPGQPLNLNLFGIFVPPAQLDVVVSARPRLTTAPASVFNPNLQTNDMPFSQFDYSPAHRVPAAPIDLSRGQPNPNIFTNPMPFLRSEIGAPRSPLGARPFDAINVALLGTPPTPPPPMPLNQYDWAPAHKQQPQRQQDQLNPTLIMSFVPPPPDAEQHSKPFFVTPGRLMNI